MTSVVADPGLTFWLAIAEREGGLYEDAVDHSLVMLPESLQTELSLPEEVVVTADPGVAREDGAILLAPGHPLLDRAAEVVIGRGDVSRAHLRWPSGPPQSMATMERRARELVNVEHGRVDVVGQPLPFYLPVLRLAVLVSHRVSLDERFLEREEVLVDATTGLSLPAGAIRALSDGNVRCGPARDHPTLDADLVLALAGAHSMVGSRIAARRQALARQSDRGRQEELGRAGSYYEATLDSIAIRRSGASAERQRLLDDQAEATRVERDRRLGEINGSFRPRHELCPFLLQLLGLPVVGVPVDIRRGPRRFPASLRWVPSAGTFAALRCPACSSAQPLVAGKDALGCRSCLETSSPSRARGSGPSKPPG